MSEAGPIFVAGSRRSGITVLADALAEATGWGQRDVTMALGEVDAVLTASQRLRAQLRAAGLPDPPLSPQIRNALLGEVLGGLAGGRAHSPRILRAADILPHAPVTAGLAKLLAGLPAAKLVIPLRDGPSVVASRLRVMPQVDFFDHCQCWAATIDHCIALERQFPQQVLMLPHLLLVRDPLASAQQMSHFLGLDQAAAARCGMYLRHQYPRRTSLDAASALDLSTVGWTTPEKLLFHQICAPAMAAIGYPLDADGQALRRAPLAFAEVLAGHNLHASGAEVELLPGRNLINFTPLTSLESLLVLHNLGVAQRPRFSGRIAAPDGEGIVRVEAIATLSRRVLFAQEWNLQPAQDYSFASMLEPVPELVDVVVSARCEDAAIMRGSKFELHDFSLS